MLTQSPMSELLQHADKINKENEPNQSHPPLEWNNRKKILQTQNSRTNIVKLIQFQTEKCNPHKIKGYTHTHLRKKKKKY